MKTFIAYRFTGEDPKELEPLLTTVRDSLKAKGVDSYCTFFDEVEFNGKLLSARQIMNHAFGILDDIDFLFVVQTSENKSEGMMMEVGYCIAKHIPIVVATKIGVGATYLPQMAEVAIEWQTVEDLKEKIKNTDFGVIRK